MDLSKFKVGDKVMVTKMHKGNDAKVGMVGIISRIDTYCTRGIYFNLECVDSDGHKFQSWCEEVSHIKENPEKPWGGSSLIFHFT